MFNSIKKFFQDRSYKMVLVFHMKSGKTFKVPCDKASWKIDSEFGHIVSYNLEGYLARSVRYINMKEIEFITQESYSVLKPYN